MKQKKPLNERIARYRKAAGYTLKTAAEALGMNYNTYGHTEREGTPSSLLLAKIAKLYDVDVNVLLFGEDYNAGRVEKEYQELKKTFTTLNDNTGFRGFEVPPPITLNATERSFIGGLRELTKEQKELLTKQMNEMRAQNKKK